MAGYSQTTDSQRLAFVSSLLQYLPISLLRAHNSQTSDRDWTVPTPSGLQELHRFWELIENILPRKVAGRLSVNTFFQEPCMFQEYRSMMIQEVVTELKTAIDDISKRNRGLSMASGSSGPSIASYTDSAYGTISKGGDGEYNTYDNCQQSLQRHLETPAQMAAWTTNPPSLDPRLLSIPTAAQDMGTNPDLRRSDDPPNDWSHISGGS